MNLIGHEAHGAVSAFAKAYALGEKESSAAVNLLTNIPKNIKEALTELVRTLGEKTQLSYRMFPIFPNDLNGTMWTDYYLKMKMTHPRSHPILRVHTQPKFVNHDGLAEGLLNHGHCTASGFLLPWKAHLTNSHGLLTTMISRMELDWISTAPKMRKAWNVKDLEL